MELRVREAGSLGELRAVADLHVHAFPGFYLTSMGRRFLLAYYRTLREYDPSSVLVAMPADGREVIGFLASVGDPERFQASLRRHVVRLGLAAVPALVRDPGLIRRTLLGARGKPLHPLGADCIEITSQGIRPDIQRSHIGQLLFDAGLDEWSRWPGYSSVGGTTYAAGNEKASRFYDAMGFETLETFDHGGTPFNLLKAPIEVLEARRAERDRAG